MPAGLEAHCKRVLDEIVTISQVIRRAALTHANHRNFTVSERLRRQLETIRISADIILEAITRASLTDWTLDDQIVDWLFSGEPRSCLERLKEMNAMLQPTSQVRPAHHPVRPLKSAEDRLIATMAFFDKHVSLFHFLITPDIWHRVRPPLHEQSDSEATQVDISMSDAKDYDTPETPTTCSVATDHEHSQHGPSTKTRKKFNQKTLDEISRWLDALDCGEKHNCTLRLRRQGTCTWLPGTNAFKAWRTGSPQLLWLHGKVGCGKSVLVASTIEYLKRTLREDEAALFFYCDFQSKRSTSSTEIIRSLLSQLIRHIGDRGLDPGDLPNKILDEKSKGTLSLDDLHGLWKLLSRAASSFRYEPIVVIDALDECADIEALLDTLVKLHQDDVRLLVTSRPNPEIMHRFSGLPSLSFESMGKELATDMALHVMREVNSHRVLRSADPEIKTEICARLNAKAAGRFRWLQCQLDILERCSTGQELKEVIGDLPTELEATYEKILDAIDERRAEGKLARRVLASLTVALQPLRLVQIIDGLSVDLLLQRRKRHEPGWQGARVLDALSSLVTYDEGTDTIRLSHCSVKDYLVSRAALPTYKIIPHVAHVEVAQMCMRYISAFIEHALFRENVNQMESWPMISYVLSVGFNHLEHVDPGSTAVLEALQSLEMDIRHHPTHWDRLCELREEYLQWTTPSWPTSRHDFIIYILIAYSSPELLHTFLSRNHPTKVVVRPRTNPLLYAADLRKTTHGIVLLKFGVDVNARGFVIDNTHNDLPLEVAVDRGDDVLARELLKGGSVVTAELISTAVCMPWFSARMLVELVQTDEFVEWAREVGEERLYRGMFNSARPNSGDTRRLDEDHVALARRLFQVGLDLSPETKFGDELVRRAVHAAHTSMLEYLLPPHRPIPARFLLAASSGGTAETVRFFIDRGVDVNVVCKRKRESALHLAASCPSELQSLDLMKVLVDAGCSPDVRNLRGETPLTIAMKRGYLSAVEYLLSANASLAPDILVIALQRRTTPLMVQLLIRKNANVHSVASSGDTVLHLAIAKYAETACLNLFKIFVKAGCSLASRNFEGKTTLDVAIKRGYVSVVEFMLSRNIPLSVDVLSWALKQRAPPTMVEFLVRKWAKIHPTALPNWDMMFRLAIAHYVESKSQDLVKIFIKAGCRPIACNSAGQPILVAATNRGYSSVVEVLLSHGVQFPLNILQTALRRRSTPEMVEFLIRNGADVHSIASKWDTMIHLAIANYAESKCLVLVKNLIATGCDATVCNLDDRTALVAAIERGYASVVALLVSYNVPFPADILPLALKAHAPLQLIQLLIRNGANVGITTSDGDTVLHLAIAEYSGAAQLNLLKLFIEAGCDPTACNADGKTALVAAIERGRTSAVELLLSHDVPFPPNVLSIALQRGSDPEIVRLLLHHGARECARMFRFHWDALVRQVDASYSGRERQRVVQILDAASLEAFRAYPGLRLEMPAHGVKRPRLEWSG